MLFHDHDPFKFYGENQLLGHVETAEVITKRQLLLFSIIRPKSKDQPHKAAHELGVESEWCIRK